VLVDAANYFTPLEQALRQAQRSILIIGWDFDGRIKLCPDRDDCPPLGDFLRALVDARPALQVHILVWSVAVIHAPGAPMPLILGAPWQDHDRIHLRLDNHHPIYAAHHQKIVCIDDALAFVGGIDLTVQRWDTCGHTAEDKLRAAPDGSAYSPVHDVQMVVEGEVARAVAKVARDRWRAATGETLAPGDGGSDLWPDGLAPDFTKVEVAVARTAPGWSDDPPIGEIAALTADLLRRARRTLYMEAQYFTARIVRDLLEQSLAAANGPEIVIIATRSSHGAMEQWVMGHNRDRLIRRLQRADRHGRFGVFYPVVPGPDGDCEILIHSKTMIVDDDFVRIGSANLNNRSMGLDTECDLVIEASDTATRRGIAQVRDRLLAEHLDVPPEKMAQAMSAGGSMLRAIEQLNRNRRGLRPFEVEAKGATRSVVGTWLLDPRRPFEPFWLRRRKRPKWRAR
jgi:phosphatidylserine/phosphatidylglycerophosphate/cardiolipin synthase-like enzyme